MNKKRIAATGVLSVMIVSYVAPLGHTIFSHQNYSHTKEKLNIETEEVMISNVESEQVELPVYLIEKDYYSEAERAYIHLLDEKQNYSDLEDWWNDYLSFLDCYSNYIDLPETIYDYYSEEEILLMARVVETETYSADFESKTHVASVIFNRIDSDVYPDDVFSVITAKGQFAYFRKNVSEQSIMALRYAFEIEDTAQGALYFHSNKCTNYFCGRKWIFSDAVGHHFY